MERQERSDSLAVGAALVTATMMIAHQVAGKATRDGLFLAHFDAADLPKMVIGAAIASFITVMLMSGLLARFGPARTIPVAFLLSALLFLAEWAVVEQSPEAVALVLYLHMAMFGAVLISGFWSTINERFDPLSAKRNIAKVAAAATLGGVLGGLLAKNVSATMGANDMLLVLAGLHFICGMGVLVVGGWRADSLTESPADPPAATDRLGEDVRSGFQIIAASSYLRYMALLVMVVAAVAGLLDWALKAAAEEHFQSSEDLVAFFGSFYAITGLAGFALQSLLGPRLLSRFGIGTTLMVHPGALLTTGGIALAFGSIWTLALARGAQMMLASSLFKSAFELLYTPVPPEQKRPTKTIIDVAADRLGDVIGSGVVILMLAVMADPPQGAAVALALPGAIAAVLLVRRLHQGYVQQLATNLRKGAVSLDVDSVVDATTSHILAETSAATEREQLMSRIREQSLVGREPAKGAGLRPPDVSVSSLSAAARLATESAHTGDPTSDPQSAARAEDGPPMSVFARAVVELDSGENGRIRQVLRGNFMDPRLVPLIIPLLGDEELAQDARMELRWLVPQVTGQLLDGLLNPDMSLMVRQRLPGVLEVSHNPRVVDGLLRGLDDPEFNVRYSCARTLLRMRRRDENLKIDVVPVYSAVRRELGASEDEWSSRRLTVDSTMPPDQANTTPQTTTQNHALECVFAMLALALDPDAVGLAKTAALSRDANLRGTALEYLENVLADDIRKALWPHLGARGARPRGTRPARELLREMRRAVEP